MIVTTSKKSLTESRITNPPRQAKDGWELRPAGRLQVLEAPALTRLSWLVHAFSTRCGGTGQLRATNVAKTRKPRQASEAEGQVLNLGFTDGETRRRVLSNRKRFLHAIGAEGMSLVAIEQIHSDVVHRITSASPTIPKSAKGDALISDVPAYFWRSRLRIACRSCSPMGNAEPSPQFTRAGGARFSASQRRR